MSEGLFQVAKDTFALIANQNVRATSIESLESAGFSAAVPKVPSNVKLDVLAGLVSNNWDEYKQHQPKMASNGVFSAESKTQTGYLGTLLTCPDTVHLDHWATKTFGQKLMGKSTELGICPAPYLVQEKAEEPRWRTLDNSASINKTSTHGLEYMVGLVVAVTPLQVLLYAHDASRFGDWQEQVENNSNLSEELEAHKTPGTVITVNMAPGNVLLMHTYMPFSIVPHAEGSPDLMVAKMVCFQRLEDSNQSLLWKQIYKAQGKWTQQDFDYTLPNGLQFCPDAPRVCDAKVFKTLPKCLQPKAPRGADGAIEWHNQLRERIQKLAPGIWDPVFETTCNEKRALENLEKKDLTNFRNALRSLQAKVEEAEQFQTEKLPAIQAQLTKCKELVEEIKNTESKVHTQKEFLGAETQYNALSTAPSLLKLGDKINKLVVKLEQLLAKTQNSTPRKQAPKRKREDPDLSREHAPEHILSGQDFLSYFLKCHKQQKYWKNVVLQTYNGPDRKELERVYNLLYEEILRIMHLKKAQKTNPNLEKEINHDFGYLDMLLERLKQFEQVPETANGECNHNIGARFENRMCSKCFQNKIMKRDHQELEARIQKLEVFAKKRAGDPDIKEKYKANFKAYKKEYARKYQKRYNELMSKDELTEIEYAKWIALTQRLDELLPAIDAEFEDSSAMSSDGDDEPDSSDEDFIKDDEEDAEVDEELDAEYLNAQPVNGGRRLGVGSPLAQRTLDTMAKYPFPGLKDDLVALWKDKTRHELLSATLDDINRYTKAFAIRMLTNGHATELRGAYKTRKEAEKEQQDLVLKSLGNKDLKFEVFEISF